MADLFTPKVDVTYDDAGNPISWTDPNGIVQPASTLPTDYTLNRRYDSAGRELPTNVNPDGSTELTNSAAWNAANVTRAQYYDYEKRFAPIEQQLVNLASDDEFIKQGETNARDAMNRAAWKGVAGLSRDNARKGIQLKPDEAEAMSRRGNVGLAAATTQAVNKARMHGEDRQLAIMSGGLGSSLRKAQVQQ